VLLRYSRACGSYQDIGLLLRRKLLNQGFLLVKLKSSLRRFYGRLHDMADRDGISMSQMTTGNPDRNHKLWNIVSTERYILHMQVLLECCYI
jgi:hypothetical protein